MYSKFILKLKVKIYQYFGIFLAHREENEFMKSDYFYESLTRKKISEYDNSIKNNASLVIGLWQAENGFTRLYVFNKHKHNKLPFAFISFYKNVFYRLESDSYYLLKQIGNTLLKLTVLNMPKDIQSNPIPVKEELKSNKTPSNKKSLSRGKSVNPKTKKAKSTSKVGGK